LFHPPLSFPSYKKMQAKIIATYLHRECSLLYQSTKTPILIIATISTIIFLINTFATYFLAYDITQQIVFYSNPHPSTNFMESCIIHNITTTRCFSYHITYSHSFHVEIVIILSCIFVLSIEYILFFIQDLDDSQPATITKTINKYMSKIQYKICYFIFFILRCIIAFHLTPFFFTDNGQTIKLQYFQNNPPPTIHSTTTFINCKNIPQNIVECNVIRNNVERCMVTLFANLMVTLIMIYMCFALKGMHSLVMEICTHCNAWFAQSANRYKDIKDKIVEV
jgi:hypothetical protein